MAQNRKQLECKDISDNHRELKMIADSTARKIILCQNVCGSHVDLQCWSVTVLGNSFSCTEGNISKKEQDN